MYCSIFLVLMKHNANALYTNNFFFENFKYDSFILSYSQVSLVYYLISRLFLKCHLLWELFHTINFRNLTKFVPLYLCISIGEATGFFFVCVCQVNI